MATEYQMHIALSGVHTCDVVPPLFRVSILTFRLERFKLRHSISFYKSDPLCLFQLFYFRHQKVREHFGSLNNKRFCEFNDLSVDSRLDNAL